MKKILLTGFEPFGKHNDNPSKIIIEGSYVFSSDNTVFKKMIFSNVFVKLKKNYLKLLDEYKPDIIINLGLDSKIQSFKIEKIALNLASDHINKGNLISILNNGENALINKLNIDNLTNYLNLKNIPSITSYHAGVYSCNYIYYLSLKYVSENNKKCIFIHLPYTHKMASEAIVYQDIVKPSLSKYLMEEGITRAIKYMLK